MTCAKSGFTSEVPVFGMVPGASSPRPGPAQPPDGTGYLFDLAEVLPFVGARGGLPIMDLPMGLLCIITTNIGMRLPRGGAALRPTGGLLGAAIAVLSLLTWLLTRLLAPVAVHAASQRIVSPLPLLQRRHHRHKRSFTASKNKEFCGAHDHRVLPNAGQDQKL
jgi:hypothetical protein